MTSRTFKAWRQAITLTGALLGGSLAMAAATYTSNCGSVNLTDFPPLGGAVYQTLDCSGDPNVLLDKVTLSEGTNHSFHGHDVIFKEGTFKDLFTSAAPWDAKGARLALLLTGFISFQGNPGDVYDVTATLEGTFDGLYTKVSVHKTLTHGGAQIRFREFSAVQVDDGYPKGPHKSWLTIVASGPGEVHITNSGDAEVTPVPEPASMALSLSGIAVIAVAGARRRKKPTPCH